MIIYLSPTSLWSLKNIYFVINPTRLSQLLTLAIYLNKFIYPYLFFIFGQLSIHVWSCIFANINLVLHLFYISRIYFVYYLIFQSMWKTCWWLYITISPNVLWTTLLDIKKYNLQIYCLQITDFNFKLNSNGICYSRRKSPEFQDVALHWLSDKPFSETVMLKQWRRIPSWDAIFICNLVKKALPPASTLSK